MLPLESLAPSQGREKLQGPSLRQTLYLKCLCPSILFYLISPEYTALPIFFCSVQLSASYSFQEPLLYKLWKCRSSEQKKPRAAPAVVLTQQSLHTSVSARVTAIVHLTGRCRTVPSLSPEQVQGCACRACRLHCAAHTLRLQKQHRIKEPTSSSCLVPLITP